MQHPSLSLSEIPTEELQERAYALQNWYDPRYLNDLLCGCDEDCFWDSDYTLDQELARR